MKLASLILSAVLLAAPAFASAQAAPELTTKQVAAALKPAAGGYALHATNNRDGSQIAFFGTFDVSDEGVTLTLTKSYDQDQDKLTPLDATDNEVFTVVSAGLPGAEAKKDGVVLLLNMKYQPTDGVAAIFLRLAIFDTGRLFGAVLTEAGSRFSVMGAPTTEADFITVFLKQAQVFHDAIMADAGEHSADFYIAWARNKPFPAPKDTQ